MAAIDLNGVQTKITSVVAQAGRAALNAMYPDEFEYYVCAFELYNSQNQLKHTFVFPVMPNMISEKDVALVNIRKTSNAVITFQNPTFIPTNISIQGTFGRKLRLLLGTQLSEGTAFGFGLENLIPNQQLSAEIKTGYGALRVLDKLINKSQSYDEFGKPYYLFFYNLALGKSYMVEVLDITSSQSMENNMLWNYSIQMKSLANVDSIDLRTEAERRRSIIRRMSFDNINKLVNNKVDVISELNKGIKQLGVKFKFP